MLDAEPGTVMFVHAWWSPFGDWARNAAKG